MELTKRKDKGKPTRTQEQKKMRLKGIKENWFGDYEVIFTMIIRLGK